MEESEKRKERLREMRMEASRAPSSATAGTPGGIEHLTNPLIETAAVNFTHQESRVAALPRFDYYTDPMGAYSGNRLRSNLDVHAQLVTPGYSSSFSRMGPRISQPNPSLTHQTQTSFLPTVGCINLFCPKDLLIIRALVPPTVPSKCIEGCPPNLGMHLVKRQLVLARQITWFGVVLIPLAVQEEVGTKGVTAVLIPGGVVEEVCTIMVVVHHQVNDQDQNGSITSPWYKILGKAGRLSYGRLWISQRQGPMHQNLRILGYQNPFRQRNQGLPKPPKSLIPELTSPNSLPPPSTNLLMTQQILSVFL